MKLERIDHWPRVSSDGQSADWVAVESCDGECYRAADVDALLASIRAAVDAERDATLRHVLSRAKDRAPAFLAAERACAALDALLADGGE